METKHQKTILVTGATGKQGGAAALSLVAAASPGLADKGVRLERCP